MRYLPAAAALCAVLSLSACADAPGVYPNYHNNHSSAHKNVDAQAVVVERAYTTPGSTTYVTPQVAVVEPGRTVVTHERALVVDQNALDRAEYLEQNEDKWMYNSCPPGAAKRGDC